jgi:hypothetical protein
MYLWIFRGGLRYSAYSTGSKPLRAGGLGLQRVTAGKLAERCGVSKVTVLRWEESGKIQRARRDRNGHRFWTDAEAGQIIQWSKSEQEVA